MVKWYVIVAAVLLSGCVSQQELSARKLTNEQVVRSSGNTSEIIRLYKQELQQQESDEVRTKLVASYLSVNDYESALFYLEPMLQRNSKDGTVNTLAGRAALGLGNFDQAHEYLTQAYNVAPDDPQVLNLIGVMSAVQGKLAEARRWFERSRNAMIDDVTVKNNLSIIDILEQNYPAAQQRLESLRAKEPLNEQARVTLSIAYAKQGLYQPFRQLVPNMTMEDSAILFQQLKSLDFGNMSGYIQ